MADVHEKVNTPQMRKQKLNEQLFRDFFQRLFCRDSFDERDGFVEYRLLIPRSDRAALPKKFKHLPLKTRMLRNNKNHERHKDRG